LTSSIRIFLSSVVMAAVFLGLGLPISAAASGLMDDVRSLLADSKRLPLTLQTRRGQLLGYYGRMDSQPLWQEAAARDQLIDRMEQAAYDGLDPQAYPAEFLKDLAADGSGLGQGMAELWFSAHFLKYAEDMKVGRLVPRVLYPHAYIPRKEVNGTGALVALNKMGDLDQFFIAWEPFSPLYRGLKIALAQYLGHGDAALPVLDKSNPSGPGDVGPDVDGLHTRLHLEGTLAERSSGDMFDEESGSALRTVQVRYGVPPTGILDAATAQALNIPLERRIRQITLSMERQRWLPERLSGTTIVINRGRGTAQIIVNGALVESYLAAPNCPQQNIFLAQETVNSVVLNPLWRVTPEYLTEVLLPRLKTNPRAVENDGFELRRKGTTVPISSLPWKALSRRETSRLDDGVYFIQYPSPLNPLGALQVPFGSTGNAFLFDLPQDPGPDGYCDRFLPKTAFGLVQGHDVAERIIAPLLLPKEGLSGQIERGATVTYPARGGVEILVTFQSAWIEPDGSLRFGPDPYGEDRRLFLALDGKPMS